MAKKFNGVILSLFLVFCFSDFVKVQSQVFNEVSSSKGVASATLSEYGSGISLYDWNVDGFDDIVLLNYDSFPRFFQNNEGTFDEVFFPDLQFIANFTSVCWIDIDNDGDLDISFNTQLDGFFLFENDGEFNFENITAQAGIPPQLSDAYAHCWADYNRDGFIDLYIPYYEDGVNGENPSRNILYMNNGDRTFSDVSGLAGVDDGYSKSLIAVWFDYNNDLWPDLFVLNDRIFFDNHLYRNNADGTFTDVSEEAGVLYAIESMSGTVGDINNDGFLDVFVTNSAIGSALLHLNRGNGTFSEVSADYNVQLFQGGWSGVWIDYDNDMLQDLFVCTQPVPGDNYLFRNMETIFELNINSGLFGQSSTFAAALGDINNDGSPDLVSFSSPSDGLQIWQNNGTENNYLKIKLQGVVTNREAIGSWIEIITPDGTHQYRHSLCGENFLAQNSQWMQVGMGENLQADTIRITWLSGLVEEYYDVPVNQNLIYIEGGSLQNEIAYTGSNFICEGDSLLLSAGEWDSYLWSTGDTTSTIYGFAGQSYSVITEQGPFVVESGILSVLNETSPAVQLNIDQISCFGQTDGSITLIVEPSPQSVFWPSLNQAGSQVTDISEGTYVYEIESLNGCRFIDSVHIEAPQQIVFNAFLTSEVTGEFCENGIGVEISVAGEQGQINASWLLYENLSQPPVSVGFFENGITCINSQNLNQFLVISLIDEESCFSTDTLAINELNVGINHLDDDKKVKVFPNPARNKLYIRGEEDDLAIVVFNALGEVVDLNYSIVDHDLLSFDVKKLQPGKYFIKAYSEEEIKTYSFMKK
jgi:hypothetical protein